MNLHGIHRAQKKSNNEWVVGYYIYCEGKHFIKNGNTLNDGWHEVYEDTLCRYCGINDICNHMIFEGDILETRTYDYFKKLTFVDDYVVRYPAKRFGFVLQTISCYLSPKSKDGIKLPREAHKMKIIGNIIDSPNLAQELHSHGRMREGNQTDLTTGCLHQ